MDRKTVTKLLLLGSLLILFSNNGYADTEILRPDSTGDYAQWNVYGGSTDYGVTSDISNSTYIMNNITGNIDLMNIENSSVGAGTINSVTIWITEQVYNGGGGGEDGGTYIKTNGQYYTGAKITFSRTAWVDASQLYTVNPQTSANWTWTEINELQAGATTTKHDADEEVRVSEVWVLVDYAAATGILNVTLITPADSSSTNITQNTTFWVNASVRCMGGNCGNVAGSVRYNVSDDNPDTLINTTTGGTPFYNVTGLIPWSCGTLGNNDLCTLNWTVNATGSTGVSWNLDVNFSSDGGSDSNDTANFQINITAPTPTGTLNVSLITPSADSSTEILKYNTFDVEAGVRCLGGNCGTVAGSVRYNASTSNPDYLVNTTVGGTPFYNMSGLIPWSCGTMNNNDFCQLNWTLNASGIGSYYLDANFSSDESATNNTLNFQINITIGADAWLNVTLITPDPDSSRNISQNETFQVNASVKCMDAFCSLVIASVRYNQTTNEPDDRISNIVGGTPFWNQSGRIPSSCGVMWKDDICILNWTVNGSAPPTVSYYLDVNFTSFNTSVTENNTPNFQINITGGVPPPPTPILNVTLITPIPYSSTNITQNNTINVNVSVRCLVGDCGNVSGSVRYNKTIPDPEYLINTTLNGIPFSNSTGLIPYNCGILNQNDLCVLNWTVNVTGSEGVSYWLDANFTSNQSGTPDNDTLNFQINVTPPTIFGILNVSLITPIPSSSTNITQNNTVEVKTLVRCMGGRCGSVAGSLRYNITIAEPDFLINTTLNGIPFSNSTGQIPWSCGVLYDNDYCQLNWTVNVTGATGVSYYLDGNYTSNESVVADNNTLNFQINTTAPPPTDTTPPSVIINDPDIDGNYSGDILINATVTDSESGVNSSGVFYWLENGSGNVTNWILMSNVSSGNWQWYNATFDSISIYDGLYNITINASDIDGNQNVTEKLQIRIDNTNPSVTFIYPNIDGNYSGNLLINASVLDSGSDIYLVYYWLEQSGSNATAWTQMTEGITNYWNATFNTNSVSDGLYNVTLNASDYAENENVTEKIEFTIDNNRSAVGYITPSHNEKKVGSFLINVSINDSVSGVLNAYYWIENSSGNVTAWISMSLGVGTIYQGYWNATFDPSGLAYGYYNITTNATDYAGNQNATEKRQFIYTTPILNVTLIYPIGSLNITQNYTFLVNASVRCLVGDCGVVVGSVRYNSTTAEPDINISVTSSGIPFWNQTGLIPYSCGTLNQNQLCTLNWSVNASGTIGTSYYLDVNFTSSLGNVPDNNTANFQINISKPADVIPPSVTINNPNTEENHSGNVLVNATVTDSDSGVDSSAVYYWIEQSGSNVTAWIDMSNISSGNWNWYNATFLSTSVADGIYNVTINASDIIGNQNATEKIEFKIDNTLPYILITIPTENENISSDNITVNGTVTDNNKILNNPEINDSRFILDSYNSGTGVFGFTNNSQINDGTVAVVVNFTDDGGNTNTSDTRTFIVDNTRSRVGFITPLQNENKTGSFLINASINDTTSGVQNAYYWFEQSGNNVTQWTAMSLGLGDINIGYWNATFNSGSLADGLYNITINATDYANNQNATEKVEITIDNIPPKVAFISPDVNVNTSVNFLVNASVNDSGTGIREVFYWLEQSGSNVTAWIDMSLGSGDKNVGYWNATVDISSVTDGLYNITINATDYTNLQNATEMREITIDRAVPTINFVEPTHNEKKVSSFLINVSIDDSTSGVENVFYWIENVSGNVTAWTDMSLGVGTIKIGYWNATFNPNVLSYGTYNITTNATDYADNQNATEKRQFIYTHPILNVTLIYPLGSMNVTQNDTFNVNASVRCMIGDCGTVVGSVRYNRTTSNPNFWINTTLNGIPFSNSSGQIPYSCGILNLGQLCILNWSVNATGQGSYYLDVNFSSSRVGTPNNDTTNFQINISEPAPAGAGILNVSLITPSGNINVIQNNTFNLKAGIRCLAGDCGIVVGAVRYNETTSLPDKWINTSLNGYPLSNNTGLIPWSCGILNQNDYCQLNWSVNVTGIIGYSYWLDSNFTSNQSVANDTINFMLGITAPAPDHNTTWIHWSCFNSTHQLENAYNNSENLTFKYYPCQYGCDIPRGMCNDGGGVFQYGYLIVIVYLVLISVCLVATRILSEEHGALKFLFFIIALIFVWSLLVQVGSMVEGMILGQDYSSTDTIQSSGMLLLSLGNSFMWVIFLVVGYFIIMLIANVLKMMGKLGKGNVL